MVNFVAASRINQEAIPVHAYVLDKLTTTATVNGIISQVLNQQIQTTVTQEKLTSCWVRMLKHVLRNELRQGIQGDLPTAQNVIFGWVLFGDTKSSKQAKRPFYL